MPSTTVQTSTPLPTLEQLDASRAALSANYNQLEGIEMLLRKAHAAAFDGGPIDFTIDDAAIGRLYRYLNDVDSELAQDVQTASAIRELVYQLDVDGRDREIRQEASDDAC